jgi:D-alanyl-D-alanine dipeptidase
MYNDHSFSNGNIQIKVCFGLTQKSGRITTPRYRKANCSGKATSPRNRVIPGQHRGNLTVISLDKQSSESGLDMGTPFDFFGPEAWVDSPLVSPVQRAHRMLLQVLMQQHGFEPYPKEWWHFTLKDEPFPNTYFNFPVQ